METQSESIGKIAVALAAAQQMMGKARMDSKNPFFKSKYADLNSVIDSSKDALIANEIAVVQAPVESTIDQVSVKTILLHSSGQWISGIMTIPIKNKTPQDFGSSYTYARRYSLQSMINGCSSDGQDDDGERAQKAFRQPVSSFSKPALAPKEAVEEITAKAAATTTAFKTRLEDLASMDWNREKIKALFNKHPDYSNIYIDSLTPFLAAKVTELMTDLPQKLTLQQLISLFNQHQGDQHAIMQHLEVR